jgi:RNA polymerase sigma-70 factor (ECF subfamily)
LTHDGRGEAGPHLTPPAPLTPRDRERFDECVLPYLDAAYNLARHLLRDAHEAEEAVQESFLRAIRHFGGFRGVDGRAWILTIVRNTCFTQIGRRRSGGEVVEFDEEAHSLDEAIPGPEAGLVRAMTIESVHAGLGQLPPEFREALMLRELEGLSYKEIAHVTGVPIGTVMSRLARARKQLLLALGAAAKEGV